MDRIIKSVQVSMEDSTYSVYYKDGTVAVYTHDSVPENIKAFADSSPYLKLDRIIYKDTVAPGSITYYNPHLF